MRFKKKEPEFEAIQLVPDDIKECEKFCNGKYENNALVFYSYTKSRSMTALMYEWLVKDCHGDISVVSNRYFHALYESIVD